MLTPEAAAPNQSWEQDIGTGAAPVVLAGAWLPCQVKGVISALQHSLSWSAGSSPSFFLRHRKGCLGSPWEWWRWWAVIPFSHPIPSSLPWWGVLCHTGAGQVFLQAAARVLPMWFYSWK